MAEDIPQWLNRLGLGQYAQAFADNGIDIEALPHLRDEDFERLGVLLGHMRRLQAAIETLSADEPPTRPVPPPSQEPEPQPAEAERRQLTVMFCDMVGSTALSQRLDPEDLREMMRRYQDAAAGAITRYEGYVARFVGDGVLAYFGWPQAHEDQAERAVRAGLDAVAAVARLKLDDNVTLQARVGIATGQVVVGDLVGEVATDVEAVSGESPNLAARLQGLAAPGQVVIGATTRLLIGENFELTDLGAHELKGFAEPVRAWRVLGEGDIAGGYEARRVGGGLPLVGRQEELGLLVRSWETSKEGHGQTVLIQGGAGIGKSRLLEALRERVSGEDYLWVAFRCSPYHANSTFYPVIEHLKRVMGWKPEDGAEEKLKKLEAALKQQSLPLEEAVPLFAELMSLPLPESRYAPLGLSAEQQRERTLDALAGWLLEEAERTPVLQVWEDVHWVDPTTLELLGLYIEQSPTVSMLNVLTYRPEFVPPWTMHSHMTPITLNRLERPEVEVLIEHQAGGKALPVEVVEYIAGKTDGVPLYVEELTKTILESDYLHEEADRYTLAGSLSEVSIPTTLQDSLMARLDRVPSLREIAQLGSVLGREFAYEMLRYLSPLEEPVLQTGLGQLVENEILYQRGRPPRSRYIFKHALIQDAAYQSLLKRTRQSYHRRVAELLESRFPEIVRTQPELVAHHYSRTEQADKAVEYLTRFAEKAAGMYAHAEAVTALEEGLVHAERLPAGEGDRRLLDLAVRQAESLHFLGRRQEIVDLLLQHQDRLERLREPSLAGQYYFWLGFAHAWLGHRAEAAQSLGRSLEEATRVGDGAVMGRVHRALATECVYSGRPLDEAVSHGRQAVSLLERTEDHFWLSQALFSLGYCLYHAGDFDLVLEVVARLDAIGEATGNRRARANATMVAGLTYATGGDWAKGIEACERALELSPDPFETAFILACLGRARWEAGDVARAVSVLEEAVQLADQVRSLQFRAWFRTMLGEAYLLNGEIDKAGGVVRKALEVSTDIQFLVGVGLSKQLLGRIAQAQDALAEAERHLHEALQTFATIGARFELGRTHLDLAVLGHAQGNREAVATHLKEAHDLFTALRVPKYVERAEQLSEEFGVSLS
jgi:class 3 adenylate cyclase/tetratricopeptide (TPR) repeat protein